ncbi:hypothetical protein Cni_G07784 [Canna indica]|uniref:High chlorophyll fluorescence 153 n=1 Tax=Canna indica TaxID=4628 RepID=A0AAQ3JZH3_9LILI|nr:hypothetical protein Cni_G07784 [Canna indica]
MAPCLIALASASVVPIPKSFPPPHLCKSLAAAAYPIARSFSLGIRRHWGSSSRGRRRLVVRAGPPSTNSLILAFVLPLSLLVGTIITAARVADRLDEKYLEELAMNEAILEEMKADEDEQEGDDDNEEGSILPEEEEKVAAVPRVRNRPKREA